MGAFLAPYSSSLKPQKMFIKIALKDFGTFWMCLSSILPLIVSFNLSIRAPIHILPISRSTACYLTFSCSNFFLFDSIRNTIDAFNSWIDVKLLNVCVALEIWDAKIAFDSSSIAVICLVHTLAHFTRCTSTMCLQMRFDASHAQQQGMNKRSKPNDGNQLIN